LEGLYQLQLNSIICTANPNNKSNSSNQTNQISNNNQLLRMNNLTRIKMKTLMNHNNHLRTNKIKINTKEAIKIIGVMVTIRKTMMIKSTLEITTEIIGKLKNMTNMKDTINSMMTEDSITMMTIMIISLIRITEEVEVVTRTRNIMMIKNHTNITNL
jgi:hypothetical protein